MSIFSNISDRLRKRRIEKKASQRSKHSSNRTEYLLNKDTPFSVTEAFRNLKASLSVSVPKRDGGVVIMTTSGTPEEGKTTVTVNLALMFALSNAKVILVDADIRKGRVAKYFKARSTPGLSDYLSGQNTLDEVVRKTHLNENLSYITCGTRSPKPYELLECEEMQNLLKELRAQYDYIIIDTPPVLLISDALAIAPFTDGVALITRHQVSYVSDIAKALNTLTFAKANILGVIVNDYKETLQDKSYGGYKRYYYYSSYAYVANESEDANPESSAPKDETPTEPVEQ